MELFRGLGPFFARLLVLVSASSQESLLRRPFLTQRRFEILWRMSLVIGLALCVFVATSCLSTSLQSRELSRTEIAHSLEDYAEKSNKDFDRGRAKVSPSIQPTLQIHCSPQTRLAKISLGNFDLRAQRNLPTTLCQQEAKLRRAPRSTHTHTCTNYIRCNKVSACRNTTTTMTCAKERTWFIVPSIPHGSL